MNNCPASQRFSTRCRNLHTVVSSGAGSRPRSIPTNRRIDAESYSASYTAGSLSAYHCHKNWIRSIRSRPSGRGAHPGIERFNHRAQLGPQHHLVHLGEKHITLRRFVTGVESAIGLRGKSQLVGHLLHSVNDGFASTAGKNQSFPSAKKLRRKLWPCDKPPVQSDSIRANHSCGKIGACAQARTTCTFPSPANRQSKPT